MPSDLPGCHAEIKRLRTELEIARARFAGMKLYAESNILWTDRALGEEA
jgi:hypothetical protein